MSWSYSGDPSSSERDECRFLIGDTDEAAPIMQDEEIDYLVAEYGSDKNMLCYQVFFRAATQFARAIKRSLGPQSEDPTKRLEYFQEQAEMYKVKCTGAGLSLPVYAYPKVFRKGMQNNPPWPRCTRLTGGGPFVR